MKVVKYFVEEPWAVETESGAGRSLEDFLGAPRFHRGYLAASDLARGLTGATCCTGAWLDAVRSALRQAAAGSGGPETAAGGLGTPGTAASATQDPACFRIRSGRVETLSLGDVLRTPERGDLVCLGREAPAALVRLAGIDGLARVHTDVLCDALKSGTVVLLAEPAHDGFDWNILAPVPLAAHVRAAFRAARSEDAVRFVIPQIKARGEHKFYFERYDLDLFREFRVEAAPSI